MKRTYLLLTLLTLLASLVGAAKATAQPARVVYVLTTDDAVTTAMADYIARGIRTAEERGAEAVIIRLDTPGGDVTTTIRIMGELENAEVPVIVYVWPRGGMAASAGTLILLAAHGAAMAPRTTIGAAHPVSGSAEELPADYVEKITNVMVEHAALFAERRGQEAVGWAERMIRESATASPEEALEMGVIDLVAEDLEALLEGLDGQTVTLGNGREVTLHTADAAVQEVPMTLIEQLLSALINPNVAFILLTIGVQAILIELSSPGGWVAGAIGVLCLALAAYALGVLPFNVLGLLLLVGAFVLFILDIKAPTHGALTAAGVATFIAGGLILFNAPVASPYGRLSLPLVITIAILTALLFAFVVAKAVRAHKHRPVTGQEGLIGQIGVAKTGLAPEGIVLVTGERWQATAEDGPIAAGEPIQVVSVEGLRLRVRRA